MSLEKPPRLFIPGPVQVEDEILAELSRPMIGHRDAEFAELAGPVHEMLKRLFRTRSRVFIGTTSATGVMEGAVRNCVRRKVLCCVNGAFSARWHEICLSNGMDVEALEVPWGQPIRAEMVAERLARGGHDAVTVVHSETSTGVASPLADIATVVKARGDVMLLVDAVTSLAVVPIETDQWKIDVLLAGSQKGLALPPGLTVFAVSEDAMARARTIPHRGTYIDFLDCAESHAKNQTPSTPAVSLIYALAKRLRGILADENGWYAEHRARADLVRGWAVEQFGLFPERGFESPSVTCIANTRGISVAGLNKFLRERGVLISNGYGDLKEKTFRIGHMGANDVAAHRQLLAWIDDFVQRGGGSR